MTEYDGREDGRRAYYEACRLIREQGLREGKFTPETDEEREIAGEGRDAS